MATPTASQSLHFLLPNRATNFLSPFPSASRQSKALPFTHLIVSPPRCLSLHLQSPKPCLPRINVSASNSSNPTTTIPSPSPSNSAPNTLLSDSTRTISYFFAAALSLSKLLLGAIESISWKVRLVSPCPTLEELDKIRTLKESLVCSVGPLFFAAITRGPPRRAVNTPVSLVAGAIVRWLDIYGGVLMVRVLLSWFPNIPWDRQPLSAIRDLCDPYLNLFRNIIPPVFNTLDISPIFAFLALGMISSILSSTRNAIYTG